MNYLDIKLGTVNDLILYWHSEDLELDRLSDKPYGLETMYGLVHVGLTILGTFTVYSMIQT